jgi:transmembrane sensor
MRNSTLKPSREMIAEASAWLIEFRTGNPGQAERDRFNAWLCASPQHIQAYFEVAAAWSELPDSDPEGRIDIQKMMRAARESGDANIIELGTRFKASGARRRFRVSLRSGAIAASVLVVLLATASYLYSQRGIYQTQIGEQRSLTLADGSTVDLNAQSKIRVRYSDRERHIDLLKGQAFFRVTKNTTRTFVVDTGSAEVRAIGTQFDVYRKLSGTIVTVLEGRVAVANARGRVQVSGSATSDSKASGVHEILLAAGEQVVVPEAIPERAALLQRPRQADVHAAIAWTQKRLVFEDTPLVDVAEEFNRYNVRRLVIRDEGLQRMGVSGLYSSTDPSALIAFLRLQPGILVTETDDEILVTRP